jgi:hypothetical protein
VASKVYDNIFAEFRAGYFAGKFDGGHLQLIVNVGSDEPFADDGLVYFSMVLAIGINLSRVGDVAAFAPRAMGA